VEREKKMKERYLVTLTRLTRHLAIWSLVIVPKTWHYHKCTGVEVKKKVLSTDTKSKIITFYLLENAKQELNQGF